MAGIVFLRTAALDSLHEFYTRRVGMKVWLEQPDIAILRHGNLLVGFHQQPKVDRAALLTFFYERQEEVDEIYDRLQDIATSAPAENGKYRIYHFFATDPEGRPIEFQHFLDPVPPLDEG